MPLVERCDAVSLYYTNYNAVDVSNHMRQGCGNINLSWNVRKVKDGEGAGRWWVHHFATIIDFCITNSYAHFKYFDRSPLRLFLQGGATKTTSKPGYFKRILVDSLLNNKFLLAEVALAEANNAANEHVAAVMAGAAAIAVLAAGGVTCLSPMREYKRVPIKSKVEAKRVAERAGRTYTKVTHRVDRKRCYVCSHRPGRREKDTVPLTGHYCPVCGPNYPICDAGGRTCHAEHFSKGFPDKKPRKRRKTSE
jgi:hypothetical protein